MTATATFTCDHCGESVTVDVRGLSDPVFRYKPSGWKAEKHWGGPTGLRCEDCVLEIVILEGIQR